MDVTGLERAVTSFAERRLPVDFTERRIIAGARVVNVGLLARAINARVVQPVRETWDRKRIRDASLRIARGRYHPCPEGVLVPPTMRRKPALVARCADDGDYLLDGLTRVEAAHRAGVTKFEVLVVTGKQIIGLQGTDCPARVLDATLARPVVPSRVRVDQSVFRLVEAGVSRAGTRGRRRYDAVTRRLADAYYVSVYDLIFLHGMRSGDSCMQSRAPCDEVALTHIKTELGYDLALISRLEGVRATASNAGEVIGLVTRAARISALTQAPIDILPIILLGPPGCGKSRVIRELGRALDTPVLTFLGSSMADATQVLGSGTGWKGAAPGRLAETLLQSPTSSPLFVAEEVEKLRLWDRRESASDILLGLLDRQMAAAHEDAYLRVPMRADRAICLLAANTLDNLSEPLLDRCLIVEMRSPEREERRDIVARMHAETRARLGLDPEVTLDGSVTEPLREISLRRIGPLFQVALGHAVEAGRDRLEVADIIWARTVVERGREPARARAGFLP